MELAKRMDAINAFEAQIDAAQAVSEDLETVASDAKYVPAVLALFERNAREDDFGVFHSFGGYIEGLGADALVQGSTLRALLEASVRRVPMWKTCELLGHFASPAELVAIYIDVISDEAVDDDAKEVAKESLEGVVDDHDGDEDWEAALNRAREALDL
jgi:hypothetical protein